MSVLRVAANVQSSSESITKAFPPSQTAHMDRHVLWNNNNFECNILNVDGSCLGTPPRACFGGLIRNSDGYYIYGFSGFLPASTDILQAELSAIYFGLRSTKDLGISPLACYSDSILAIDTIIEACSTYHVYAVLIHEIKVLLA